MGWLILAAGSSRRFKGDKLLAIPPGLKQTLLEQTLQPYRLSREPLLVVTREDHTSLHDLLTEHRVDFTVCPDSSLGMAHSLRWGVSRIEQDWTWLGVVLADMPGIKEATVRRLVDLHSQFPQSVVRPEYRSKALLTATPGHPVLFPRRLFSSLLGLKGDAGARAVLSKQKDIVYFKTDDPGVMVDVDTRDQLKALAGFNFSR